MLRLLLELSQVLLASQLAKLRMKQALHFYVEQGLPTWEHISEGVEHGLGVQASGQGLVLRGEPGQGILPAGGQLIAVDGAQL